VSAHEEAAKKDKMVNLIPISILTAVLALYPASLRADTFLINPDMRKAQLAVPDANMVSQMLLSFTAPGAEMQILLTQYNETEEKMIVKPVPAEKTYVPDESEKETPQIFDPLAPVNKIMFHVNDKLYFWVLKPVAQGYSFVVPELVRIGFGNAYDNLRSPARIANNLLQLRLKRSGNEFIRFLFNSVVGVGGLGDASKGLLGIEKQEADFGQTLGSYGLGHGLYLVLPIFGPSSVRDGVGLAGDTFMNPMIYVSYFYLNFWEGAALYTHEKVNDTSFRIGDYEAFKQAAIDPYVSMRDAFVQYRLKKVEEARH